MSVVEHYPDLDTEVLQLARQGCEFRRLSLNAAWSQHIVRYPELVRPLPVAEPSIRSEFASQMFALDMAHIWMRMIQELGTRALYFFEHEGYEQPPAPFAIATIAGRIAFDLLAVKVLVTAGLDVQAKQIVRAVSENLDALMLSAVDEEFGAAFAAGSTPEACSKVWHAHIAKGKARRTIGRIAARAGAGIGQRYEQVQVFRRQEEAILGASAHPSTFSGAHSIFQDVGRGGVEVSAPTANPYSLWTLGYCNFRLGDCAGLDKFVVGFTEGLCEITPASFGNVFTVHSKAVCCAFRDIVGAVNDRLAAMSRAYAAQA